MAAKQSAFSKVSPAARLGIGGVVVVMIALLYWVVFYSDISAKIESARRTQTSLRTELVTQQQAQASYFQDRDELALRQQRQREFNKALPEEAEAASFLSALQQVANTAGVDFRAWQPQDEKIEAFYAKFPMKIEMSGRFHQIAKFAFEVGRVERIINLENIELADPKLDGDGVVIHAKCLATTFHALKPKPAGKPAGQQGAQTPPAGAAQPGGKK
jgi:type IV pilus assembly protein PilO